MGMPMAAAYIAYQKYTGPNFFGWRFCCFLQELIACKLGPSPNDDHAHGGGMDWLSKTLGAENFWMAILLVPIKNDQLRGLPKPERCTCPMRRHGLAIKNFRGRNFLDGDSVDSYKNGSAERSAQTRTMGMPDAAA